MSAADGEREVLDLHERFCAGFAGRNAQAVLRTVAQRSDLVVVTSEEPVLRGAEQLVAFLERYVSGATSYSWLWDDREASVSGAVAWLVALGTETATTAAAIHRSPYRMTAVAERLADGWRLVQVHGSSPHHPS